jgi:hypothetical protein
MTSSYAASLSGAIKERYISKLAAGSFPDPLDEDIRQYIFQKYTNVPPIHFGDIYFYLVEQTCFYTREQFRRAYRVDEGYNSYISGYVRDVKALNSLHSTIFCASVAATQRDSVRYSCWVILTEVGEVQSGHCTCMAG